MIGQGMLRRGDDRTVVVMTSIGPNTHEEAIEFRDFNKVDGRPMETPAEFGAVLRQANREMIRKFGVDGSRLFVSNMEPSTQQFGDIFPDWQPAPQPQESCVTEAEKHCKHKIGGVNRCTAPAVKGCYGKCEEHFKSQEEPQESCVTEAEKHCKHKIGGVNRCTAPAVKGCYGKCEEHFKMQVRAPAHTKHCRHRAFDIQCTAPAVTGCYIGATESVSTMTVRIPKSEEKHNLKTTSR